MNYYFLSVSLLIFSSSSSQLSFGNELSYDVYVGSKYPIEQIQSIECTSRQQDGTYHPLAHQFISPANSFVHWSIEAGGYNQQTEQRCHVIDKNKNILSTIIVFRGSWKLDEILWQYYTFYDFIFQPHNGKYVYIWFATANGAALSNFRTKKDQLVVPTFNFDRSLAEIFIVNMFGDKRKIVVICTPKEKPEDHSPVNEKALQYGKVVGWSIKGDYFSGEAYTCLNGWTNRITGLTDKSFFTAFDDSWELDEILKAPYTRSDFIFNPYSREHYYIWSLSEKGLSLYNFKLKKHLLLQDI